MFHDAACPLGVTSTPEGVLLLFHCYFQCGISLIAFQLRQVLVRVVNRYGNGFVFAHD